jgi:uncharacterized membrane protein
MFKLSYLVKGFPGHPLHPPVTDATIGAYTTATVLGILSFAGVSEQNLTKAWWLALLVGLGFTAFAAATGLLDWLTITWRTPLWWTATWHMLSMLTATGFFALAAAFGHDRYVAGRMGSGTFIATIIGFVVLTFGGWLGGTVVFTHGMRVLNLVEEPTARAITPGHAEKEMAEQA